MNVALFEENIEGTPVLSSDRKPAARAPVMGSAADRAAPQFVVGAATAARPHPNGELLAGAMGFAIALVPTVIGLSDPGSQAPGAAGSAQAGHRSRHSSQHVAVGEVGALVGGGRLERRFRELQQAWGDGTRFTSSATEVLRHPAYLGLIALGVEAVPLILADWATTHRPWSTALVKITGDNPIRAEDKGLPDRVRDRWFEWGRAHGFRC